jgi:hypothetical protein
MTPSAQETLLASVREQSLRDAAEHLAQPVESNRILVQLAKLQVRYALGVFLDRLERLDVAEGIAHAVMHDTQGLPEVYARVSRGMANAMYQGMLFL